MNLKRDLSFFDVTNIIIGSIIGADIYIASSLTAGMVGPLAIFVWIVAGVFAIILALIFAYCSHYVPRVSLVDKIIGTIVILLGIPLYVFFHLR